MHIVQIRSRKLGFVSIEWSVDRAKQEMPLSNDDPEHKNHVSELKYIAERENEVSPGQTEYTFYLKPKFYSNCSILKSILRAFNIGERRLSYTNVYRMLRDHAGCLKCNTFYWDYLSSDDIR